MGEDVEQALKAVDKNAEDVSRLCYNILQITMKLFKEQKACLRGQGFTLIELLVVITLIGILASIVLVLLNTARSKGGDAAIKADVTGIRAAAEVYYDNTNSSYGSAIAFFDASCGVSPTVNSLSADGVVQKQIDDAVAKNGGIDAKCAGSPSFYVIAVPLKSNAANAWCVDNSGNSKQIVIANFTLVTDTDCIIAGT